MPGARARTHDQDMDTYIPDPTGPTPPPPPSPHGTDGFFAAIRHTGLFRSDDRWVGGVAGGLARRFGIDPLLVRAIFAVSFLLGGLGLVAYGVGWALLPEQRDGRIHLEETIRGRFDVALLGAIALVIIGLSRGDHWWWGGNGVAWIGGFVWLAGIIAIIVLIVNSSGRRRASGPRPPTPYGPYPAPGMPPVPPPPPAAGPAAGYSAATPYGPMSSTAPSAPYVSPAPYAATQYAPYAPSAAPVATALPRKAPTRGPGAGAFGVVVALTVLTLAGLLLASRQGYFDGPVLLTTAGIAIVLLGLGILVSGLRGRTSGVLGFFAIVTILVAGPLAFGESNDWHWNGNLNTTVRDSVVVMTTRDEAAVGYSVGAGDTTVDLRQVPLTTETLDVPIHVGVGTLIVLVPAGSPVTADVQVGVGDITWDIGGSQTTSSGIGNGPRHFTSTAVADGADAQLALNVSVGAGDVTIKESR
jgi:phage shock protein PspC (stress-responsive transcriptional regulator)